MSKQAREEQYRPIKGEKPRSYKVAKLSPGQSVGTSQSQSRGKQGNG